MPSIPVLRRLALIPLLAPTLLCAQQTAPTVHLTGTTRDPAGQPLPNITLSAGTQRTTTDALGTFDLTLPAGPTHLLVRLPSGTTTTLTLDLQQDQALTLTLRPGESVSVSATSATADVLSPDPSTQGYTSADLLPSNAGPRPGTPVSIPGYPVETASGGIKAPQYFAPGVAGDHGEPVAQFIGLGDFLIQNNLTANAHGNGYADPNFLIPSAIAGALVDNAAYNARLGDHAVNLAVTFLLPDHLPTSLAASTDGRDVGLTATWSPRNPSTPAWIAAEALAGNGFLARPEERQQYRINALRAWSPSTHRLSLYAIAYYGFSRIPGLIPIDTPVPNDTIDPRQSDLTHTTLAALVDRWQISPSTTLTTGAFLRTYSLALRSNFGDGLLEQSEFRTVLSGSTTLVHTLPHAWTLLAGLDLKREAPRNLDLRHEDAAGTLQLVTSNDLTLTTTAPFAAIQGSPLPLVHLYLGLRHDQIRFSNRDLLTPANSFQRWPGITTPKLNLTLGSPTSHLPLPSLALSYGQAFHANDPRIGTPTGVATPGDLLIRSRELQLVVARTLASTDLRLTLAHVTSSSEFAKIDPDTGLQQDVGPSLNRFLTLSARHRFTRAWLQGSWSQADARDRTDGTPIPEAPRTIIDAIGGTDTLPLNLHLKAEFEYVKAKPLGDSFTSLPVREIRLDLARPLPDTLTRRTLHAGQLLLALSAQLQNGYSGQTLETLHLPSDPTPNPTERPTGVPLRSYAAITLTWHPDAK